jgi:hypothetical protein
MKKITCCILLFLAVCHASKAQFKLPKVLVAAHLEYASPTGTDFSNQYKYGFGGDVEAGVGLGKTLLTGILDYKSFAPHSSYSRMNVTSVKVGLRQYLLAGLFLNLNGGGATIKQNGNTSTRFVAEGGAGFKLLAFEIMANYGGFTTPVSVPNGNYFAGSFIVKAGFALKI